jgi:hypothetical protein
MMGRQGMHTEFWWEIYLEGSTWKTEKEVGGKH